MTRRQIRAQRKAAEERDWMHERDEETESDGEQPEDEYPGMDFAAGLAQEFRG